MKRLLAILALLCATQAYAADSGTYTFTDSSSVTHTVTTFPCNSTEACPLMVPADSNGVSLSQAPGSAIPSSALMVGGSDGTDLRALLTDTSGRQVIVGAGTAGSAAGGVLSIQGVASMTPVNANTAQVNGVTTSTGTGAVGTGTQRIAVGTDTATIAGSAPSINLNVINGANTYNTVAASQTAQALTGGSGGATGDYLSHCTVVPTTVSPGVVTILDNSTTIYGFPGGTSSLSNLVPFTIPVGAKSTSGAWKVTTGSGLSVVCVGKFT